MAVAFLSHRGADAAEAERLARDLKALGHEVWLDTWRMDIGDSIVGRMNEGLTSARFLILCMSAAGTEAPWMSTEWHAALTLQLDGHDMRLLPARFSGGRPPAILAHLKHADLAADWHAGVRALDRALRR